ncbi:sugar transporter, partial [Mitosporidium daphniae]
NPNKNNPNPNKNNPNPNKNNPNPNKNNPNPNKNNPNSNSASPLRKPRPKSKPDKGFKRGIKIFKILVGLYIFQQFSFINEYFSCTEEMFDDLPNIYIFLGVANFAGTFLNVAIEALKGWKKEGSNCLVNLAESVDMKHIYVTSLAGCAISSLLLLLISFLKNIASIKSAAAFGFIFCFSFGFGPSPWMIVPRILLPSLQEDYDSFGSTLNWLCAFIITFTATGILPFFKKISLLFLSPFCLFLNLTMGHLLLKF